MRPPRASGPRGAGKPAVPGGLRGRAHGPRTLEACGPVGPTKLVRPRQPCPPPGRAEDGSPRRRGCRRLNHLSLCSPQLNGSGQLKMSSHCLSAQMLAPPPPGLPRLALPPVTKPTSEGGSTSPTSPCKHSGKRCPWAPHSPPRLLGPGGCRRVWCVHRQAWGCHKARPVWVRAALGSSRGKSAVCPLGQVAQSHRVPALGPEPSSPTGTAGTAGESLHRGPKARPPGALCGR